MAIQFVGSKSLEDRRRRRLAVHCDAVSLENSSSEEVTRSGRVESELVESEAAAPWVPVHEWRIWTYGVMVGLLLIAASFSLMRPSSFRPELAPLSNHLLQGSRPVLAAVIQTLFWFLCAQLAILIAWYRVQCKLDFGGRYRVWPWAAGSFGLAAFCSATHAHVLFGEIISQGEWLHWRGAIVAWLLPTCVVALPLTLLIDRDVRRGRSTLYTLRVAWFLGLSTAGLELFAPDLDRQIWFHAVRSIVPLFSVATLFLGLWLHARVVAYVCPDPPDYDGPRSVTQFLGVGRWCIALIRRLFLVFSWRRRVSSAATTDDSETKPKRRTRKTIESAEVSVLKPKRKVTVRKAVKPRKPVEIVDQLEDETDEDESINEDSDESSGRENSWDEDENEAAARPARSSRSGNSKFSDSQSRTSVSDYAAEAPTPKNRVQPQRSVAEPDSDSENTESDDTDTSYRIDEGMTADQMRGLSKRQKRELRQKLKDQQRT